MRKAVFFGLALMPQAVFAQDIARSAQGFELSATAPANCVVQSVRATGASNASFQSSGTTGGQVTITRLVDAETAEPRATTIDIAIPATCNASHRVTARSGQGGLQRLGSTGAQGTGFAEFLPYSMLVGWAGVQLAQTSNQGPLSIIVPNGATGELALRIATPDGGTPLVAGQYEDSIVVQLQPAD